MTIENVDYGTVLSRKMLEMFPDFDTRAIVHEELTAYGQEEHEREPDRVRVAILKVAGDSLDQIRQWVKIAKNDFRDVLASAEYPNELVTPTWEMAADRRRQIRLKDGSQYEEWIGLKR